MMVGNFGPRCEPPALWVLSCPYFPLPADLGPKTLDLQPDLGTPQNKLHQLSIGCCV